MLANDARTFVRSAVPTAIAGALLVALGGLLHGARGAFGGLIGVAVVTAFFALSMIAVNRAAKISPSAMFAAGMATYLVKILLLLGMIAAFKGITAFDTHWFGVTALLCILVWSAGQVVTFVRVRVPYVDPTPHSGGGR
jgi:ATP synthase protein I